MANKIILKSEDGEIFEVDKLVACQSQTIKHMIEDNCTSDGIPLPNVTSKILAKVIEYCKKHVEAAAEAKASNTDVSENEELRAWDAEFIKVDQSTLFDILVAANYLSVKGLLELLCMHVADMMRDKTPHEIREIFNIKNDYTKEEEDQVRQENAWAFE